MVHGREDFEIQKTLKKKKKSGLTKMTSNWTSVYFLGCLILENEQPIVCL